LQRDELADEECRERLSRRPPGREEPVLGADEAHSDVVSAREWAEEMRVRFGVGDDEVGGTEGTEVDPLQRAGREGARTEAAAVADERVRERDEWVEHHRPPARRTPRRRQVEMSWVADDERVEAAGTACEQPGFCRREAQRASRAGGPALTQV